MGYNPFADWISSHGRNARLILHILFQFISNSAIGESTRREVPRFAAGETLINFVTRAHSSANRQIVLMILIYCQWASPPTHNVLSFFRSFTRALKAFSSRIRVRISLDHSHYTACPERKYAAIHRERRRVAGRNSSDWRWTTLARRCLAGER